MKSSPFLDCIYIDYYSSVPKYLQVADSIVNGLREGKLQQNQTLPSINQLNFNFEISRDTAEKAYKYLKGMGILNSVPGKGYYIKSMRDGVKHKVFLMFNKLSPYKKIVYDAIVDHLGPEAIIDFYVYNNDCTCFQRILQQKGNDYTHYVIMPHFTADSEQILHVINALPKNKLILLDRLLPGISGNFSAIYEDFQADIADALGQALPQLSKYQTLKLVFPPNSYYPAEIRDGFISFCTRHNFNSQIIADIVEVPIHKGDVFIALTEEDVVILAQRLNGSPLLVGRDVGLISYNDTPLKKIALNGITTISTDFNRMGELTARMIMNNEVSQIQVPFYLTLRSSL